MAKPYWKSQAVSVWALALVSTVGLGLMNVPVTAQTSADLKSVPMVPAPPPSKTKRVLTLDRLFNGADLSGPRAVGVQLSPDGNLLTYLKPIKGQSGQSLWAMPVSGGDPYVLLDAGALNDPNKVMSEAEKAMRERMRISASGIISYSWSADSKRFWCHLTAIFFVSIPVQRNLIGSLRPRVMRLMRA